MAFRADEAAAERLAEAKNFLIPRSFSRELREQAEAVFAEIVSESGPAVSSYPTWHPLLAGGRDRHPHTLPGRETRYNGLDHTRYFAHGFVTCPYGDGGDVVASVNALRRSIDMGITASVLDCKFYNESTTAVYVRYEWSDELEDNHTIPKRAAVALMIAKELPNWRTAEVGETWETMRPYFLGSPHGSRSSLFVTQDTAVAMKKVYTAMNEAGVFGPIYGRG